MSNIESLIKCLEPERVRLDEPLSAHTTFGVGGKADIFYTTETSGDLVKAVRLAKTFKVPVTVIGDGSGVVVSDLGIRGMVIRNKSERIQIKPQKSIFDLFRKREVKKADVIIDSGVNMGKAIEKLQPLGIVGLEKYALLAGSVGAMISKGEAKEMVKRYSVIDEHGGIKTIVGDKNPGKNIVTDVTFVLNYKDPKMKEIETKPVQKKKMKECINCVRNVFENINEEERKILNYPTGDAGYLVGEILNMKGFKMGKVKIAKDDHNTIENLGKATAKEYVKLVEEIKRRARETLGIELMEKVVRLGFDVE